MKLTFEAKLAYGGHSVLSWMMDNIFIRRDPEGNIKRDKEKTTEKIDGAVATDMAFDRAIMCGEGNTESVYDKRGILCCMRLYFFQHLIERTSETIGGDFFPLFLWYYIVLYFFIGYS